MKRGGESIPRRCRRIFFFPRVLTSAPRPAGKQRSAPPGIPPRPRETAIEPRERCRKPREARGESTWRRTAACGRGGCGNAVFPEGRGRKPRRAGGEALFL